MNIFNGTRFINEIFHKEYFTFTELCCKCGCNTFYGDKVFLRRLLLFRILYNTPFTPRSVYRCKNHKDYSTNHDGHAIDVPYEKDNANQRTKIVKAAIGVGFNRIGISKDFIHLDDNPEYNGTINEEVLWFYKGFYNK